MLIFKKYLTIISLLTIFLWSNLAHANEPIGDTGFRDLVWGETITAVQERQIELIATDFDRDKKLYNYWRKPDSYSLYGVGFYPIAYQFWNEKFVAILANFQSNQSSNAFQNLYNGLVAQFGLPTQQDSVQTQERITWHSGKITVRLNYNRENQQGNLHVFDSSLLNDYSQFIQNLPKAAPEFPNQPTGINGMKWGEKLQTLKAAGKEFKPTNDPDGNGEFTLKGDSKEFAGVPITKIHYAFTDQQLSAAYIYYKNNDTGKTFNALYKNLISRYDKPAHGRYLPSENARIYVWQGQVSQILLYNFLEKKEGYLLIATNNLSDTAQSGN